MMPVYQMPCKIPLAPRTLALGTLALGTLAPELRKSQKAPYKIEGKGLIANITISSFKQLKQVEVSENRDGHGMGKYYNKDTSDTQTTFSNFFNANIKQRAESATIVTNSFSFTVSTISKMEMINT